MTSPLNTPLSRGERLLTGLNAAGGTVLERLTRAVRALAPAFDRLVTVLHNLARLPATLAAAAYLGRRLRAEYRTANERVGTVRHRYQRGVTRVVYSVESILLSAATERMGSDRFVLGLTS